LMSPVATREMLRARYSAQEWQAWELANESVRERQQAYDDGMIAGTIEPIYKFDNGVLHDGDVEVTADHVTVGGQKVPLDIDSSYEDMRID
jgi:acetoacetyl-[acyl-carrier protein] synthase